MGSDLLHVYGNFFLKAKDSEIIVCEQNSELRPVKQTQRWSHDKSVPSFWFGDSCIELAQAKLHKYMLFPCSNLG